MTGEQIGKTSALQNTEGGRGDRLNGVLDRAEDGRGHTDRVPRKYNIEDLTGAVRQTVVADRPPLEQRVDWPPYLIRSDDVGAGRDDDVVCLHLGGRAQLMHRQAFTQIPLSERTMLVTHALFRCPPSQTDEVHILFTE